MFLHIATPLLESRRLCDQKSIWLKLENTQPSGSFKIRGIGYACQEYQKKGAERFISSSGGNAELAVAYAGRKLGLPVKVIVPESTTEMAKNLIRKESAEVIVHGESWADAHEMAMKFVSDTSKYIHPFDNPLIWEGHSTLVEEIANERTKPQAIVLSVGGGGLYCGVVQGLRKVGWLDVPVIAVETKGADSMNQSIVQDKRITLDAILSIATSLGARQIAEKAFQESKAFPTKSLVVSDAQALQACRKFLYAHHMLVEPACGAAIAVALSPELTGEFEDLVVIVCGGIGVSEELLHHWETKVR